MFWAQLTVSDALSCLPSVFILNLETSLNPVDFKVLVYAQQNAPQISKIVNFARIEFKGVKRLERVPTRHFRYTQSYLPRGSLVL